MKEWGTVAKYNDHLVANHTKGSGLWRFRECKLCGICMRWNEYHGSWQLDNKRTSNSYWYSIPCEALSPFKSLSVSLVLV